MQIETFYNEAGTERAGVPVLDPRFPLVTRRDAQLAQGGRHPSFLSVDLLHSRVRVSREEEKPFRILTNLTLF